MTIAIIVTAIGLWSLNRPTSEELGKRQAAQDASRGHFAFMFSRTFTERGAFLGTPGCHVPPENDVRVTDVVYLNDDEYEEDKRRDEFATAYNAYLVQHYPKQTAAICRR